MTECLEVVRCVALIVGVWFGLAGWKLFQSPPRRS